MTDLRTAAQQALEALEYRDGDGADQWKADVIITLRAALAEPTDSTKPVVEPTGWLEAPHGAFRVNPNLKHEFPPQSLEWRIPLFAALAEPDEFIEDETIYCPTCGEEDGGTTCGMPDCGLRCGAEPVQSAEANIGCLGMPVNTPVTPPQRTAEPVQEPVLFWHKRDQEDEQFISPEAMNGHCQDCEPLYAAPPQRLPLTEEEIDKIADHLDATVIGWSTHEFTRAIERAHRIKE